MEGPGMYYSWQSTKFLQVFFCAVKERDLFFVPGSCPGSHFFQSDADSWLVGI